MAEDNEVELRRRVEALEARVRSLETSLAADAKRAPPLPRVRTEDALSFTPPDKPSLESRIGSQILSRVGIVALLVGAALFLKYAVDERWLGPGARVLVGIGAGFGLIAWSERFRAKGFPVFSFSLKAVGTGVLYLALWASFALFHLVSFPVAMTAMALVTAGNAWLCWAQRSEVLAAYALAGGFLTPVLLTPAHTSVLVLGCYLLLLNAALFGLLALRQWPRLLPAAFLGTICYLLTWGVHAAPLRANGQTGEALGWTLLFFAGFSLCPMFLLSERQRKEWPVALTAAANATLSAFAVYPLLPHPSFAAHWIVGAMAAWFGMLLLAGRSRPGLGAVHAGIVAGLAAAGMVIALPAGGVILGWVLEACVLLGLSHQRAEGESDGPGNAVLGSPAAPALLLIGAAVLLTTDASLHRLGHPSHAFLNERFGLFMAAVAGCVWSVRMAARHHRHSMHPATAPSPMRGVEWARMGAGSALLATLLLLAAGAFEVATYWGQGALAAVSSAGMAERFSLSAWAALLGLGLLVVGFRIRWAFLRWQALALLTLAIAKVFLLDARTLSEGFRILSFLGLGVLLLAVSFIYQRDLLNLRGSEHSD
jgi:uncharacterized membrane protein